MSSPLAAQAPAPSLSFGPPPGTALQTPATMQTVHPCGAEAAIHLQALSLESCIAFNATSRVSISAGDGLSGNAIYRMVVLPISWAAASSITKSWSSCRDGCIASSSPHSRARIDVAVQIRHLVYLMDSAALIAVGLVMDPTTTVLVTADSFHLLHSDVRVGVLRCWVISCKHLHCKVSGVGAIGGIRFRRRVGRDDLWEGWTLRGIRY